MTILTIEAGSFAESLKSAQNYTSKDDPDSALSCILLSYLPRQKKLAVIACDGHGYFERRLPAKNSIKSGRDLSVCLAASDAQALLKLIPSRPVMEMSLEIEDSTLKANLPNGATAAFNLKSNVNLPDYASIRAKADKARKSAPRLGDTLIPVHELLRAGKALPIKSGSAARIYTDDGNFAVLEWQEDKIEIRIIFTFARNTAQAA